MSCTPRLSLKIERAFDLTQILFNSILGWVDLHSFTPHFYPLQESRDTVKGGQTSICVACHQRGPGESAVSERVRFDGLPKVDCECESHASFRGLHHHTRVDFSFGQFFGKERTSCSVVSEVPCLGVYFLHLLPISNFTPLRVQNASPVFKLK